MSFVEPLDGLVAVRRFLDFVAGGRQRPREPAPQRVVIIRDENATHQ